MHGLPGDADAPGKLARPGPVPIEMGEHERVRPRELGPAGRFKPAQKRVLEPSVAAEEKVDQGLGIRQDT
jgi:hypothetical protein